MPSWDAEAVNMAPCEDFSSPGRKASLDARRVLARMTCWTWCVVQTFTYRRSEQKATEEAHPFPLCRAHAAQRRGSMAPFCLLDHSVSFSDKGRGRTIHFLKVFFLGSSNFNLSFYYMYLMCTCTVFILNVEVRVPLLL